MKTKKHKEAKSLRWNLVHSAGCVEENCYAHWVKKVKSLSELTENIILTKPVSVPRSLRHLLGRYIQGNK